MADRSRPVLVRMLQLAALGAGAWLLYSALGLHRRRPLTDPLRGTRWAFDDPEAGGLAWYHDGPRDTDARPLLLVHSVNAAAASHELAPVFEHYRSRRPVYALDLPGFGHSERGARRYTPALMTRGVEAMVERLGEPVDIVAFSLGCEFAAGVALRHPDLVRSLVMIAPTGFQPEERRTRPDGLALPFRIPGVNQALYDLLVTRPSLRYFLRQSFAGPVPRGMVEFGHLTSHQPGAAHAPYAFVSGLLFTPRVRTRVYAELTQPVLALYSRQGFVSHAALPAFARSREGWQAVEMRHTRDMPHFEQPHATWSLLDAFWEGGAEAVAAVAPKLKGVG